MGMIRRLFKFDEYKMNSLIFGIVFIIISVWTLMSFIFAWAQDEGTLGGGSFDVFMADSFNVLRFPWHNILFLLIDIIPFLGILYFPLLLVNVLFYTVLLERLITVLILRKNSDPLDL